MPSPEVAALIRELRAHPLLEQLRTQPLDVAGSRANFERFPEMFPLPSDVRVEKVSTLGVPAEWVAAPGASDDRAILFFHGGGYVIGSAATHRELSARISRASGARVLVIDYRLGPEHPYPAAIEDAFTSYEWLLAGGISAKRIALAGDSAGGGLVIATSAMIRDAGLDLPAAGVCLSPWIDLECGGAEPPVEDRLITREGLRELGRHYLGGRDPKTPLASPLHLDLRGLEPIYVQVGTAEVLLGDAHRLVANAKKAGVEITLDAWDGLFHVFQLYPVLPEAAEAVEKIGAFVRAKTG
jgi:epsilon-lactone hydrolase